MDSTVSIRLLLPLSLLLRHSFFLRLKRVRKKREKGEGVKMSGRTRTVRKYDLRNCSVLFCPHFEVFPISSFQCPSSVRELSSLSLSDHSLPLSLSFFSSERDKRKIFSLKKNFREIFSLSKFFNKLFDSD